MRYNIGQVLFVVQTATQTQLDRKIIGIYSQPLMHDNEQPIKINFTKLEVTEHHKVRDAWEEDDKKPTCDGYLLEADSGEIFANQYPTASYGQTSDTANRRFNLHNGASEDVDAIMDHLRANPEKFYEGALLTELLSDIAKGIRDLSDIKPDHERYEICKAKVEALQTLQANIHKEFKEKYPDYLITTVEKALWTGAKIKRFVTTIYRTIKVEELAAIPVEKLVAQFKGDELLQVVFPSGDYLIMDQQIGTYMLWNAMNPHARSGLKTDIEHISLYYVEYPEDTEGGYVHQTEYFHPSDVQDAVEALLRRALGKSPLRATSGSSLEVIYAKESLAHALRGSGTYEVNMLNGGKEIITYSSQGDIFKLVHNQETSNYELITAPRDQDREFTSYLPEQISAEIAVAVYKKLVVSAMAAADENEFGVKPESLVEAVRAVLAEKQAAK